MNSRQDDPLQSSSALKTYIGYVTGPRAEHPVGVRVVEPPPNTRQYQRGNLYTIVELSGQHPDRAAVADRLLSEVQRVYYTSRGSQSQVMVDAVQHARQQLREVNAHSPQYPLHAGFLCVALLNGRLLVVSSGSAFALVRASDRVHMFPSDLDGAHGSQDRAGVEVYRQDVQADDALFLGGGSWLSQVAVRTLASIVAFTNAENCNDAADELFEQAGQMPIPGLLIVLAADQRGPRSGDYPAGGQPRGPGSPPRPAPRRPRFGGLPTSLNTTPPAQLPAGGDTRPAPPSASQRGEAKPGPPPPVAHDESYASPHVPESEVEPPPAHDPSPQTTSSSRSQAGTESAPRDEPKAPEPNAEQAGATVHTEPGVESGAGVLASQADESAEPLAPDMMHVSPETLQAPETLQRTEEEFPEQESAVQDATVQGFKGQESADPEVTTQERASPPAVEEEAAQPYPAQSPSPQNQSTDAAQAAEFEAAAPDRAAAESPFLPQEPGDEVEPLFPDSHDTHGELWSAEDGGEASPQGPGLGERLRTSAGRGWQRVRDLFTNMLPERAPAQSEPAPRKSYFVEADAATTAGQNIEPETEPTTKAEVDRRAREALAADMAGTPAPEPSQERRGAGRSNTQEATASSGMPAPVLEMSPFAPPKPTSGARARLFVLIALLLLILVPSAVAAFYFGQGNDRRAEAEELTARAELIIMGAQTAMDEGDNATARSRLTEAQDTLAQAIELDGANENRSRLIATIESELQEVLQVEPLYGLTSPMITFPAEARPQRVLVVNEDIFVLDAGRQMILQYRFDPSTGQVTDESGQTVLQQGDSVGGATVGTLADMAWLPLVSTTDEPPSLLVVDRNNNIFRYDQRVAGVTRLELAAQSEWGSIGQIQTYNGRIYLADEARGQLLRFGQGITDAPGEPWFSTQTQANLSGLLSLEIDGDVWMLFNNGLILRYRTGEQLPFSPENSVALAEEPVDMVVTRQNSDNIYLVDAAQDRILVYDKSGAYLSQLRAPEDDLLRGLAGLYIDEVSGDMYILTQTGLFHHPLVQ